MPCPVMMFPTILIVQLCFMCQGNGWSSLYHPKIIMVGEFGAIPGLIGREYFWPLAVVHNDEVNAGLKRKTDGNIRLLKRMTKRWIAALQKKV